VVLTSDHGENLGEHDYFYDHGDYVYGPSLRVPLAVVLPSGHPLHGARRIEEWVSLVDVLPTLVDLMGLTLGDAERRALDGRSLLPALRGEPLARRPVFAESGQSFYPKSVRRRVSFDISGRFRTVIDGRWKLDWTPGLPPGSAFELYDLVEDPGETRDLNTPGHPEVARLRALLRDWMRPNERERREPRAEDLRALRELGYVE
jgi:arylsulfatase A-like enzyme